MFRDALKITDESIAQNKQGLLLKNKNRVKGTKTSPLKVIDKNNLGLKKCPELLYVGSR